MKNLTRLFRLLEITRAQPQYGYALAEISKSDMSDLAQHHYLVTIMAWQLARLVKAAGCAINVEKVLEISLVHDLGELFGGDIAMPYSKANPAARKAAKQFEAENYSYLAGLFEEEGAYVQELGIEVNQPRSLEGVVAKLANYVEVTHFKLYVHRLSKQDIVMATNRMKDLLAKISDPQAVSVLTDFIDQWTTDLGEGQLAELFESSKE